jgi:hypothetical protein|tara:strand:+ start:465 stop:701 length:237 start_codon:yes stop_codon:yes gene_type:complete
MVKDPTQDKLIQLIYNELPPKETVSLLKDLSHNKTLYDVYQQMKEDIHSLNSYLESPNNTSIKIILEESCSSSPMEMI